MVSFEHNRRMKTVNCRNADDVSATKNRTWYQSPWLMPRACNSKNRSFRNRYSRILHRSPRLSNLSEFDSKNRFRKYFDSDFWNRQKNEVLQGLEHMNIHGQNDIVKRGLFTHQDLRKMRRSRCYICHTRGLAYWNCPNMNRRRDFAKGKQTIDGFQDTAENYQVIGSDGKGWNEIWYVSDIHPRHMTPNLEVFEKFKRYSASSSTTGKSEMDVQGLGEVMVRTESHKFVIPGEFYVPNISLNILSLT